MLDEIIFDWKYIFVFTLIISVLSFLLFIFRKKKDYQRYLELNFGRKKWREKLEQNKKQKLFNKALENTTPKWTIEFIQGIDFKVFIDLIFNYFKAVGFIAKTSSITNNLGIFFLYEPENNLPFALVGCRSLGCDIVSLDTVKYFYDLSKTYNLDNLILITTGSFSDESYSFVKGFEYFHLVPVQRFISLLSELPIKKQTHLFVSVIFAQK
jgi:hypothetical protein